MNFLEVPFQVKKFLLRSGVGGKTTFVTAFFISQLHFFGDMNVAFSKFTLTVLLFCPHSDSSTKQLTGAFACQYYYLFYQQIITFNLLLEVI